MQQCAEEEIHDNQEQQLFHTGHLLAAEQPFQLLHMESKLFVTVEWAGAAAPGPHDVLSVRLTEGDAGSVVRLLSTPSASPTPHATVPPRNPAPAAAMSVCDWGCGARAESPARLSPGVVAPKSQRLGAFRALRACRRAVPNGGPHGPRGGWCVRRSDALG